MFHTALTELKPKELEKMDSAPVSFLPKNFNYYAGGHVHIVKKTSLEGYKNIVYPGPLFPNNFSELEKLKTGGFYIYDEGDIEFIPVKVKNIFSISVDADHKTPEEVNSEIIENVKDKEFLDTIVLIRISGVLESGRTSDIDYKRIYSLLNEKSAYFVMKNIYKLQTKEFQEIKVKYSEIDKIEESLIDEHLGHKKIENWDNEKEKSMTKRLMKIFNFDKKEGERVYEYEDRVKNEVSKLLEIEL
jgi:hypothetical protein